MSIDLLMPKLRFKKKCQTKEGTRGVAVGNRYFWAIGKNKIGQYNKRTCEKVGEWKGNGQYQLNGGTVVGRYLFCPNNPYEYEKEIDQLVPNNTIEVFLTSEILPLRVHTINITKRLPPNLRGGSLTWVSFWNRTWWCGISFFGENAHKSRVVKLNQDWRVDAVWPYPKEVIHDSYPNGITGGSFGPDGFLYLTVFDKRKVLVLQIGRSLKIVKTHTMKGTGHGIDWDIFNKELYAVDKHTKEVFVHKVTNG